MMRKIIFSLSIVFLSGAILIASQSSNFSLIEFAFVAGGEKAESSNFTLSHSILGEVIGESHAIFSLDPTPPKGGGVAIDARGTIDDNGARLNLEVDNPEARYNALIENGSWSAKDVLLSEGMRQIVVTGIDALGNIQIQELQVVVDTVLPSMPTLSSYLTTTKTSPQRLSGTKQKDTSIWLNGREVVPVDASTIWQYDFFLEEGENPFSIFAKDRAGNASVSVTGNIILEDDAPTVTITYPVNLSLFHEPAIEVLGTVGNNAERVVVSGEINNVTADINGEDFTASGIILQEGWNLLSAIATDESSNSFMDQVKVYLDTTPPYKPTINEVTSPTDSDIQVISGTKDSFTALYLNGTEIVSLGPETEWHYQMHLKEGENPIVLYVVDDAGLESEREETQYIYYDPTPPYLEYINDDGEFLVASSVLHAKYYAIDPYPKTDIVRYEYGIGTEPGLRDVLDWTSTGEDAADEVSNNTLDLMHSKTYYFTVRALNTAGAWSEPGNSDGITVNKSIPEIESITPPRGAKFIDGRRVEISISSDDADGDILNYRYFINGALVQEGEDLVTCEWRILKGDFGCKNIEIRVNDGMGGEDTGLVAIFVHFEPIAPPEKQE